MIDAELYVPLYVIIVLILTLIVGKKYSSYPQERLYAFGNDDLIHTIVLAIFMIVFVGTRPISYMFCDMAGYAEAMTFHTYEGMPLEWDQNYAFTAFMAFLSSNNCPPMGATFLLCAINITFNAIAARKMFPNDSLLALLVILGTFSMLARLLNGIKAGCAMSLFLCALAYREKRLISYLFLFLSMGFHHSMQMAIAAYLVCSIYKKPKLYFYIWIACFVISAAHIQTFQYLFGSLTDEKGAGYLMSAIEDTNFGGRTGFRLDFVLFNLFPTLIGYIAVYKKKIESKEYIFILNMYMLLSSVWMLCMYAPYTNRIAEIPWGVYPIVLIYPFLKEKWSFDQYKIAKKVAYINVGFLFFMEFVYYTFIHLDR